MSEAVRESTPVEVLETEIKRILSMLTVEKKEQAKMISEVIEKAKLHERDYYDHQYTIISNNCKNLRKENKVLKVQNKVLTEYIIMKEQMEDKVCL